MCGYDQFCKLIYIVTYVVGASKILWRSFKGSKLWEVLVNYLYVFCQYMQPVDDRHIEDYIDKILIQI